MSIRVYLFISDEQICVETDGHCIVDQHVVHIIGYTRE